VATAKKTATKKAPAKKKPAAKKGGGLVSVSFPPVRTERIRVRVRNRPGSPLVPHKWAEKGKLEILAKQLQIPKQKKGPRNPHKECVDSAYWIKGKPSEVDPLVIPQLAEGETLDYNKLLELTDKLKKAFAKGTFGIPSVAFAKAMVSAVRHIDGPTMAATRGMFFVVGDAADGDLVTIQSKNPPTMREDNVTIGMGKSDLRFRCEFAEWEADVTIEYDPSLIKPNQLTHLLDRAGFGVGVLENRPEKGGQWGRFMVVKR